MPLCCPKAGIRRRSPYPPSPVHSALLVIGKKEGRRSGPITRAHLLGLGLVAKEQAKQGSPDMNAYAAAKSEVVEEILKRANKETRGMSS